MTRKHRCENCGVFTKREQQYGVIERVICNECSRASKADCPLSGTMDGVVAASRDEGAEVGVR